MQGSNTEDPYTGLANAIILQAVKDYRDALKKLSHGRANKDAEIKKQEILNFFRSDWFGVLTEIDPEMLIRKLDEEVGA
jgi:hypothetical protein